VKTIKNIKPKVNKKNVKRVTKLAKQIKKNIADAKNAALELRKSADKLQDALRRLDGLAPMKVNDDPIIKKAA
jgi:hypothetical protein